MKNTLPLVLMLSVLLGSCSPGATGMFAGLEVETKIPVGTLSKATVSSMAEDSGHFYVAGGLKLYTRSLVSLTDSATWTDSTSTITGASQVLAVASVAGHVFALAGDGSTNSVYKLTSSSWTSSPAWGTALTLSGGENPVAFVPVIGSDGRSISSLLVVAESPLINGTKGGFNKVYLFTSSATQDGLASLNPSGVKLSSPVTSAATDGTSIYLANASYLWKTGANLATPAVISYSWGQDLSTVLSVSGTTALNGLYVGTKALGTAGGSVFLSTDSGATWTSVTTNTKSAASALLCFTTLLLPKDATRIYAGTLGSGYGELRATAFLATPSTETSNTGNYDVSTLPTSVVTFLYATADGTTVCLGTNSLGLWTQGTDKTWKQQ